MATGRDINVRLTVRDDGTVVMKRFGRQVDRTAKRSERSLNRMRQVSRRTSTAVRDMATSFGLLGGAVGVAAFVLPITAAVRATNQLDVALAGVRAVSGATAAEMEKLEQQARSLGATTQFTASQAGEAQEFLARAGFEVNEILSATPATLDLAAAGSLNLARAADIASNVLQGFQKDASELQDVVDVMAATTSGANTNVEQMGSAMSFVAPVANSFGVSIRETAAGIAVLSNAGLQGQRAGTGLRRVLVDLAAPSGKLQAAMGGLSLESDGLVAVLKQLAGSTLSASDAMEIFGQRGGPAFNLLRAGAFSAEDFANALDDVDGAAAAIAETKLDNLSGDARKFVSAMAELGIQVGKSGLVDDLRALTQSLTEFARGDTASAIATNLIPAIKEILFLLTALVAARFGSKIFAGIATSATSATGSIHLLSRRLNTARGRFVLAGRAARGLGAAVGVLGGGAGLFILATLAAFRLVRASDALEEATDKAKTAQERLNAELEKTGKAAPKAAEEVTGGLQFMVIEAKKATEELVRQLRFQIDAFNALGGGSIAGIDAAPNVLKERLAEAREELEKLKQQLDETQPSIEAFGGIGPKIQAALGEAGTAAGEGASAMDRLEESTARLNEQQERAISDARAFAAAQQEIVQAQFEARAPTLDTGERTRRQEEVNEEIKRLQRELHDEELRIAGRTAEEQRHLLETTVVDEEQLARGRLAIEIDLAKAIVEVERQKRDQIKQDLVAALNEEKRLRQLAERAATSAAKSFFEAPQSKNDRLIQLREEAQALDRNGASIEESIEAWERYNEATEGSFQAQNRLRELGREAKEQAEEVAAQEAERLRIQQEIVKTSQENQRKLTEGADMKTTVSVDDSEFVSFLDELAEPSEHDVKINVIEGKGLRLVYDQEGNLLSGPQTGLRTGGPVPGGYGGGDKVDVKAEAGEFMLRKEVGRVTGLRFLTSLNANPDRIMELLEGLRIRPPIYRQAGGPIGDLPEPGFGSGARDQVDINLNINGERISGTADRDFAEGLARALKGLQSSVAGGV